MSTNIIDKVIGYFSPGTELKRTQKRLAIDILKRRYEGAREDRRTSGWVSSEDAEATIRELTILRQRSIDLYRNQPYAFRAHESIVNNVVGTGIIPAISNTKLKDAWKKWSEELDCDFDENLNFYGLQNLVTKTLSVHGECLILKIVNKEKLKLGKHPLELKVIASNYLDSSKDTENASGGGFIKNGIHFDRYGKKMGYLIFDKDPNSADAQSKRWDKDDVIHLFRVDSPGQTRGVPFGVASMMTLKDYDDFADAQLVRQKVAACFSVFVTGKEDILGSSQGEISRLEKVEPGIIEYLEPGESVTFASPPQAEGFSEFTKTALVGSASGFNMSYESMTGDLSNVNFSSGRMGRLEYNRSIEAIQWFIIVPKFCKTVWKWFVEMGILAGIMPKETPLSVEWTAPRIQMIDPVKETQGLIMQLKSRLISWQEVVRSLGYIPEDVIEEMKQAAKMFKDAGLSFGDIGLGELDNDKDATGDKAE